MKLIIRGASAQTAYSIKEIEREARSAVPEGCTYRECDVVIRETHSGTSTRLLVHCTNTAGDRLTVWRAI